jgi:hypothetical protein
VPHEILAQPQASITPIVFADLYGVYSTAAAAGDERAYVTQSSHVDNPRVNLLSLGAEAEDSRMRIVVVGQYGDSADQNYAGEAAYGVRFLQQGYLGYYLTNSLRLDGGVFPSYLGAENWISSRNIVYTRSFTAEFSPYYQSGIRMKYRHSEQLSVDLFLLNGWQNISDDAHPAFGSAVIYRFDQTALASNSFVGVEDGGTRVFHDLSVTRTFDQGTEVTSTIDTGYQSAEAQRSGWWWGASMMGRAPLVRNVSLSARVELFQDPGRIVAKSESENPFRAYAASLGVDVSLARKVMLRAEIKRVVALHDIFIDRMSHGRDEFCSVLSLSYLY